MGTIKQGILGGFSGKVGTVIGGNWKGIDYMRGKAASVSNPKTEAQLDQRARFGAALKFLQPLTSFIRVGFKNYAVKMTAFNSAMSYNLNNALAGGYPDYFIDYASALVSRGVLPGALNPWFNLQLRVRLILPGKIILRIQLQTPSIRLFWLFSTQQSRKRLQLLVAMKGLQVHNRLKFRQHLLVMKCSATFHFRMQTSLFYQTVFMPERLLWHNSFRSLKVCKIAFF